MRFGVVLGGKRFLSVSAIVITIVFWGFSYISTKSLLNDLTPLQIAGGRLLIASLVLTAVGLISGKLSKIERNDGVRLFWAAFLGIVLYFIFENSGLKLTTAGMGSLIIATIPVLNVIVASVFQKQTVPKHSWLGVILSLAGVYIVIRVGSNFSYTSLWGNILILGAAVSWVGYTVLSQPLIDKYDTITLNTYQAIIGAVFFLLFSIGEGKTWPLFNVKMLLHFSFLAVCCSALAYVLYLYALKHLGATVVTTFINFIPVCGVLGGIIFLDETLSIEQLIGGLVIFVGVMLVTVSGRQNGKKSPAKDLATMSDLRK